MTSHLPIAFAAALLIGGTAATAQMAPTAQPTAATKSTATKTTTTKTTTTAVPAAKPTPAATVKATTRTTTKTAAGGRMVTTKTSTGKTITYNCSLAGNKTKAACK